jgi:hypothetical protein
LARQVLAGSQPVGRHVPVQHFLGGGLLEGTLDQSQDRRRHSHVAERSRIAHSKRRRHGSRGAVQPSIDRPPTPSTWPALPQRTYASLMLRLLRIAVLLIMSLVVVSLIVAIATPETGPAEKAILGIAAIGLVVAAGPVRHVLSVRA